MSSRAFKYETRLSFYLGSIVLLISTIPMVVTYFVVSHNASQTLLDTLSRGLQEDSILISRDLNRFYYERMVDIRNISQADVLETDDLEAIGIYLAEITAENPDLNHIEVSTLDGVILAHSSDNTEVGQYLQEFYPSMKTSIDLARQGRQGDVYLSNLVQLDEGPFGVVLITPITEEWNSLPVKLLLVETNLNSVYEIMADIKRNRESIHHHIYIVDSEGRVITATDDKVGVYEVLDDLVASAELRSKFSGQGEIGSVIYRNANGIKMMAGYADMAEFGINQTLDWSVITTAPFALITAPASRLKTRIGIAVLLIGSVVFIIMFLLSRKVMRIIWAQANYDPLTNLPNRRLFTGHLEQNIKLSKRNAISFALLFIDLDRFKEVNDQLGHLTGDLLLKDVAMRIQSSVREVDSLARIGGDEFALILTGIRQSQFIEQISEHIIEALNKAYLINGEVIHISASIGITLCPEDSDDATELLKNADRAMYKSKELGRNRFSYFTPAMQDSSKKRHQIALDLRIAISEGQFELHYQPIINTETRKIVKAEALIRWRHPQQGLIYPEQFLGAAEESNLMFEIGDWVFAEAARQLTRWRKTFDPGLRISINVSPSQFKSKVHMEHWLVHLEQNSLAAGSVIIEINEELLMGSDSVVTDQLLQFRDAGIPVAIDDFGTGYSTLSHLKKFHIDYLKIDKAFVNSITPDSNGFVLAEAIAVMSHTLGLKLIAEGIETKQQFELLSAIGCDACQGYYFSRPVTADEFDKLLAAKTL